MEEMQNQELCILLDSILALLETNNEDKAKEIKDRHPARRKSRLNRKEGVHMSKIGVRCG